MSTTSILAGLLGLMLGPTMLAKAFSTPYPPKAAMFGLIGAVAFLAALALTLWVVRSRTWMS